MSRRAGFMILLAALLSGTVSSQGYNMIETAPRCFANGICTAYGRPGTAYSWHESSEERAQRAFLNAGRMHSRQYLASPWGRYQFGTYGPQTVLASGCGTTTPARPLWFYSDANEAARWNQWDCSTCSTSCGHNTCAARCHLFGGDCGFGARAGRFVNRDGARATAEGLCGANMCFTSGGHCSAIYNPQTTYVGIGHWPVNTNGVTNVYVTGGPAISYPIPSGAHFDQRIKTNAANYYPNNQHMVFMANWWRPGTTATGYVAYNGVLHAMRLTMGSRDNGVWELPMAVPSTCAPYFFVFVTSSGQRWRLPENDRYLFGTAWTPWSWWTPPSPCTENHYWRDGAGTWRANGGPTVPLSTTCRGCAAIPAIIRL